MHQDALQAIYTKLIGEAVSRLDAANDFLDEHLARRSIAHAEAAILQVRKALESIALAAIAPDKKKYAAFRAAASKDPDFTKDFHAAKIFGALEKVNPKFYPRPLLPGIRQPDGRWHFPDRQTGFLSKKRFQRAYDRLGRHLHAHNPWDSDANLANLVKDLPVVVAEAKGLLHLHARFIHTDEYHGVWIVEAWSPIPHIINAVADGPFRA